MILYLDTSVILRYLLDQAPLLEAWGRWQAAYTSALAGVEARRVFDRLRLSDHLDDEGVAQAHDELARVERAVGRIALTEDVLQRASLPMPTAVGTLDAIHLTTAMMYREDRDESLVFATHDQQQALAARAVGFQILGV